MGLAVETPGTLQAGSCAMISPLDSTIAICLNQENRCLRL